MTAPINVKPAPPIDPLNGWHLTWQSREGHTVRIDPDGALVVIASADFDPIVDNLIKIPKAVLVELAEESAEVIHNLRNK